MNCPSRTDEPIGDGYNQNPPALAASLTTRQDLNGIANSRLLRRKNGDPAHKDDSLSPSKPNGQRPEPGIQKTADSLVGHSPQAGQVPSPRDNVSGAGLPDHGEIPNRNPRTTIFQRIVKR